MDASIYIAVIVALLAGALVLWFVHWRRGRSNLVHADTRLELALWASAEELWELDVGSGRLQRRGSIQGLHPTYYEFRAPSLQAFLEIVHRQERDAVAESFRNVISGVIEHGDVTYRVHDDKGGWIWLHSRGRAVSRDANNQAITIVGTSRDITELKEREQRLRFALEGAGEELWEVETKTGALRRENAFVELLPVDGQITATQRQLAKLIHPDDVDEVGRKFATVMSGAAHAFHAVYRFKTPDGSYMWLDSQGQGLEFDKQGRPRRVLGTTRDVSAIKYSEQRLRLALWGSHAELWDVDMTTGDITRDGRMEHIALAQERLSFSELLEAVHPDDTAALRNAMIQHAKGAVEDFEAQFRSRNRDGAWCWFIARGRVTERDASGWARRMLGTLHDVTELKGVEAELRRLNEDLEARVSQRTSALSVTVDELRQSNAQLREAQRQLVEAEKMASLGSLVAGVAHEINTPLGISVTATSHMDEVFAAIAKTVPDPDNADVRGALARGQRCVQLVLSNLDRASHLVRSFKQVAVDQSNEEPRRIFVAQYLDEILASLHPRLKHSKHKVRTQCAPDIEVETYPGALYQIIVNLVMNSLVHAFTNGKAGTMVIAVERSGQTLEITYTDDGAGMSDETRARIFEPFFTTRRGQGGTGLGLHIVYNLVTQLLRGTIECRSSPGQGSTFIMRLPEKGAEVTKAG
jgi:PAS domain S-box-containing protein